MVGLADGETLSLLCVLRFQDDERQLPVLWHQSLLSFVSRYKDDLSSDQKAALYELLEKHHHGQITSEVRHELVQSKCRGDAAPAEESAMAT